MSAATRRRNDLVRALCRAGTPRRASTVIRRAADLADAQTAQALFTTFHQLLTRDPRRAQSAVAGAAALAGAGRDPELLAWRWRIEGTWAHVQGNSRAGARELQRAAERFQRVGRTPEAGDVHRVLIDVLSHLGRDREARLAARRAGDLYRRGGITSGRRIGDLEMNVGNLHTLRERTGPALAAYQRATKAYRAADEPARLAIADYNIAVALALLDRRDEARERFAAARAALAACGHGSLARQCDQLLCELELAEGRLDQASSTALRLEQECTRNADPVMAGHCALAAAEAALRANLSRRCSAAAQRALTCFSLARHPTPRAEASALLGAAALQEGRLPQAARALRQAEAIHARLGQHAGAALALAGLIRVSLRRGRVDAAFTAAQRLARRAARLDAPSRRARAFTAAGEAALAAGRTAPANRWSSRALVAARLSRDARAEFPARMLRAAVHRERGDAAAERRELRAAERLVERMRLGLSREESRLAFGLDKAEVYEALVANLLARGTETAVRDALRCAERGKARALAERLARGGSAPRAVGSRAVRELLQRLAALDRAIASADRRIAEARRIPGLRSAGGPNPGHLSARRDELLARLSELDPQAALLQGRLGRDPLEIVARLADDEIVLEFALARGRLQVFSIERSGVAAVRDVADERQVHELIDRLRFLLGKGVLGEHHHERFGGFNARATRHYLEQLHRVLLQPVADRIEGRRVRIVPHGVLHGLPFHALERDGVPLIERAAVSYAPSLAVIRLLGDRPRRRAAAPPLVLGVADDAAPQIAAEVEVLSRILPSALLKTGAEATRDAVQSGNHDRPLIHVACHGYYTDAEGAEAGLRLGDAWLQLSDIYALSATAPLVVLSGCETGRGTVHAGDEWIGLVSGFLQAGANSVVAALWELHDASAADLMEQFYRGLVEGRSVAEAMAQAQRRARAIDPSPIRWAPFSVVGDPDLCLSKDLVK